MCAMNSHLVSDLTQSTAFYLDGRLSASTFGEVARLVLEPRRAQSDTKERRSGSEPAMGPLPSAVAAARILDRKARWISMSLDRTSLKIDGLLSTFRVVRRGLTLFWVVALLSLLMWPQQPGGLASLKGTVRDPHGNPVAGATVQLRFNDAGQPLTAYTDPQGAFHFPAVHEGVYVLSATSGSEEARMPSLFLAAKEAKTVDLTVGSSKSAGASATSSTQPQFFDQPQFTVAGVTDTTNLGGHGSDTVVRTREKLAEETVSLGRPSADRPSVAASAAEKSLRETVAHEPSSFDANHHLGQVLIENGKAPEAISYLERAAKVDPGNYENAYDLALANADTGNYERARDSARSLIALHDKAELHHLLGDVEEKLGDPLEAVREYQRAAELDPREAYVFDWGSELLLHHAPEPAIEVFTKGSHLFPRSERMLLGLGAALFANGSSDEAVRRVCQASDLDPDDPSPYLFLGKIQRAEAVPSKEVVEKLHRFVTLQPESAEANYYYAVALWKLHQRQPDQASASEEESLLTKSVHLDAKLAVASLQLGILHFEAGNSSAAISDYQRALQVDPQMEDAHYRLAQAYRQGGHAEKAKEELKLYEECVKESAQKTERERHEIRQFVYTLRDQSSPQVR
jgi:tetratricopeptide (TPR) repeat protein